MTRRVWNGGGDDRGWGDSAGQQSTIRGLLLLWSTRGAAASGSHARSFWGAALHDAPRLRGLPLPGPPAGSWGLHPPSPRWVFARWSG